MPEERIPIDLVDSTPPIPSFRLKTHIKRKSRASGRAQPKQSRLVPALHDKQNVGEAPHVQVVSIANEQSISRFFEAEQRNSLLICGDAERAIAVVPAGAFQTCITSPPYWSLRDYKIAGQIGLEQSVAEYIDHLVRVFAGVMRTLREDGTLWVNIGDSYTSGGRTWRASDKKNPVRAMQVRPPTPDGLKPKDLIGIPWLLAFALQKQGWYLRADIIWNKPNCQPESVKDRPTRSHEYVFSSARASTIFTIPRQCGDRTNETCALFGTSKPSLTRARILPPSLAR